MNQQQQNTALERSVDITGGFNQFYCQIFALDASAVKPEKNCKARMEAFLTYPMNHHWKTINCIDILL